MDVLNSKDKGDSIKSGHAEEEENGDDKNEDEEAQDRGKGMIDQARMFLIGPSDVNV